MTNWKVYTITSKKVSSGWILFSLDNSVRHKDSNGSNIYCKDVFPFYTCQVGDYLEIDNDRVSYYSFGTEFSDTSIIRKVSSASSSAVVPSSSAVVPPSITRNQTLTIGRELDALIDQSGGRNEYEAKVYVDTNNRVSGYSIVGRRSNNSNK